MRLSRTPITPKTSIVTTVDRLFEVAYVPMMQKMRMPLHRYGCGTSSSLTMPFIRTRLSASDRRVATSMIPTIETTRSGRLVNSVGPGVMPQMIIEPIMTAITESPGMPSAIVVVSEPPSVALEAVSDAATPSIDPLPNISGCFDALRARSQPMSPAMSPPAAGMRPTPRPTAPPTAVARPLCFSSARFGHHRPRLEIGRTCDFRCVRSWSKSSAMPKRPMMTAMKFTPSTSSSTPNVKRWSAVAA